MNYKLLTLLILFSPLSYAANVVITIPSSSTPEGINLTRYNELHLTYQRKAYAEKTGAYTEVAPKERVFDEARVSGVRKAKEEAANKKADAKKIASSAKRDFENKIMRAWQIPTGSAGQRATARVLLTDNGSVQSITVQASDPDVKASVEQAVRSAAPYPMPSDPDARREARSFTSSFTVK